MARYGDDGNGSRGRNALVVAMAVILAAFFAFWRTQLSPGELPQATAAQAKAEPASQPSASDKTPAPSASSCQSPALGSAGVFTVHFDFDQSDIRGEDMHWIESAANAYSELARTLKDCGGTNEAKIRLGVIGHADSAGARDYNQKLSERRAAEVTRQLTARGVPQGQIDASGVGEDDLAVPTKDNTPNAANRRAVMTITVEAVPTS